MLQMLELKPRASYSAIIALPSESRSLNEQSLGYQVASHLSCQVAHPVTSEAHLGSSCNSRKSEGRGPGVLGVPDVDEVVDGPGIREHVRNNLGSDRVSLEMTIVWIFSIKLLDLGGFKHK